MDPICTIRTALNKTYDREVFWKLIFHRKDLKRRNITTLFSSKRGRYDFAKNGAIQGSPEHPIMLLNLKG